MNEENITAGYGLAALLMSLQSLALLMRKGTLSKDEIVEILTKARHVTNHPEIFPGDPGILQEADRALKLAETILWASSGQRPPGTPH